MARAYKPKTHLDKLQYSPTVNPLMEPQQVKTKRRLVRTGRSEDLVNPATGEISGVAAIHQIEEKDDAEFVKVFAAGVAAGYELTKTAQRVFQVVLDQYQRTPMSRGYADAIELFWFGDGIEGRDVGMKEEDIDALAAAALADVCTGGNPRDTNLEEIKALYRQIF
mgnify:CR=1 FL=1